MSWKNDTAQDTNKYLKANVTPMCAEQYRNSHPVVRTLKSGEEVLVDPELTVQRLFMW